MDRKVPRMLSWAPVKQTPYEIIIDSFFHAKHRFKDFQVSVIVATDQEKQHFPVPFQFAFDSECSSSSLGVVCSLRKEMAEQQSTILNEIKKLENRFEGVDCRVSELHDRFDDEIDGHLLDSEDVGPSGSEACNKCHKIDERKKSDEDVPRWD
ncbi:hypothetical protein HAX54_034944 [Datura stramonium]|uniref:Uncharacterized protein n=1 Tax=Datura stramonium TaxID=4076 RepID=A0ABS8VIB4_DATST|nr:hypothetical protein [Datura stramonium]